ncbi:MAG: FMN-binding protein [Candidatus Nanopelagicales bacterium]
MKRILYTFLTTLTIVVLLFGYRTSTMGAMRASDTVVTAGTNSAAESKTVTGSVAQTEWGPVQVQITVSGSEITDVQVLQYPNENGKDQQINAYALPVLTDETLQAQSANIDMVSGATVTSNGYISSLQAALDEAGL